MPEATASETPNPTAEQKNLAVLILAAQATVLQLIMEGVIPPGQEVHFQLHLSEFINQFHRDGKITIGKTEMVLDNQMISDYSSSAVLMATEGERIAKGIREKLNEAEAAFKQTNKDEDEHTDPDLSPKRVLN